MQDEAKRAIVDHVGSPFFISLRPGRHHARSHDVRTSNEREQQSRGKGTEREGKKDWRRQTFVSEEA